MAQLNDLLILGKSMLVGDLKVNSKIIQGSPSTDSTVLNMNRLQSDLYISGDGSAPNSPKVAGFYLGKSTSDGNRHMDIVSGSDYSYIDFNKDSSANDYTARLITNVSTGLTEYKWDSGATNKKFQINGTLGVSSTAYITNTLRIGTGSAMTLDGNWCEGIRINAPNGQWATIALGTTGETGTNPNCWSIHRTSSSDFTISKGSSDGANGLVMTSTGMGLGTTNPSYRLQVNGSIGANGNIYIGTNSGAGNGLALYSTSAPNNYGIHMSYTSNYGTYGQVSSDWATYFCFDGDVKRGWIFKHAGTNVFSINGQGTLSIRENVPGIFFRPGHASYDANISYQTSGNEALVFTTKAAVTSFMFVNGEDTITNMASDRWTKVTPGLQIKQNCVSIGKLIASGSAPTHTLEVGGTAKFNGVVFGYNYTNSNNAAAFIWDKPGSNYTGVGANGTDDTIYFSACSNTGSWVTDYKQKWVFNGTVSADSFNGSASSSNVLNINNSANLDSCLQYIQSSAQTSGNDMPSNTWWHVIKMNHGTGDTYYKRLLAFDFWNDDIYTSGAAGDGKTRTWKRVWVEGNSVTGAVWNDYAEYRESDCKDFGYVLCEKGDDTLTKTTERLSHFAGVSSDTWGFSQGKTERATTPIAVAGRVLVYPYQNRNNYKPGDCVCAAPGGTVDIMTREEVIQYPDRIVGTVSCVPEYDTWGGGERADRPAVAVNGRIWIKVK